jgi:hypothetical protein
VTKHIEKCCIHKLEKAAKIEKQKSICEHLENKIGNLIDRRLKTLTNFS